MRLVGSSVEAWGIEGKEADLFEIIKLIDGVSCAVDEIVV